MNSNLISYKQPKSPVSESYRMLRTNLQYLNVDKEQKAIVVTSSNQGEGKTTTMANLAITLSQIGKKVLLIDCDLRKPRIHKAFNIANTQGVVNIVVDGAPISQVTQSIETVSGLHIITSGPIPPNPSEILESQAMRNLIEELKERYDVVLFDAPPVCSVTDAAVLASMVDGIILVIASGETNIEAAKLSKKLLDKTNSNILGVVLSKADTSKNGGYYYNYYEYGVSNNKKSKKNRRWA